MCEWYVDAGGRCVNHCGVYVSTRVDLPGGSRWCVELNGDVSIKVKMDIEERYGYYDRGAGDTVCRDELVVEGTWMRDVATWVVGGAGGGDNDGVWCVDVGGVVDINGCVDGRE